MPGSILAVLCDHLRCPVCAGPLAPAAASLSCPKGHSFDIARHGYVNLLTSAAPASVDTPDMVAARDAVLRAGHFTPIADAIADLASVAVATVTPTTVDNHPDAGGLVVDAGAGTGYYLAAALDALPEYVGLGLDISKAAARRCARAHRRAAAAVCDVWRALPLADGCATVILNVFAPRNAAQFARVLRPDGALLVVSPLPDHLAELVHPLGLLTVDPDKSQHIDSNLSNWFVADDLRVIRAELALSRAEANALVAMGPSAWHLDPDDLTRRLADLAEPIATTLSVRCRTYRRLTDVAAMSTGQPLPNHTVAPDMDLA